MGVCSMFQCLECLFACVLCHCLYFKCMNLDSKFLILNEGKRSGAEENAPYTNYRFFVDDMNHSYVLFASHVNATICRQG